jgi:hypothetical protein
LIKYALRLIKLGNRFARRIPVLPEDRREGAPRRTVMPTQEIVSARAMLAAMIDGRPIPCCWPILRGAGCVARFLELAQALTRHFDAHHAQLAKSILRRLGFCSPWLAFVESLWRREPDEWRRPVSCEPPRHRFTCGSTALTVLTSTLAHTATPICTGRPTASASGSDNTLASSPISTTTGTGTP